MVNQNESKGRPFAAFILYSTNSRCLQNYDVMTLYVI